VPLERILTVLEGAYEVKKRLTCETEALIADARRNGASWKPIGEALGCTAQAVQKRYGGGLSDPARKYLADLLAYEVRMSVSEPRRCR